MKNKIKINFGIRKLNKNKFLFLFSFEIFIEWNEKISIMCVVLAMHSRTKSLEI